MTGHYLKVHLDVEDFPSGREHTYVRQVRHTIEEAFPGFRVKVRAAICSGDYIETDAPDEETVLASVEALLVDVRDTFFREDV